MAAASLLLAAVAGCGAKTALGDQGCEGFPDEPITAPRPVVENCLILAPLTVSVSANVGSVIVVVGVDDVVRPVLSSHPAADSTVTSRHAILTFMIGS